MPGVSIVATSVPRPPVAPPPAFGASFGAVTSSFFGASVCVARFGGAALALGVGVATFGAAVTLGSGGLIASTGGTTVGSTTPTDRVGAAGAASIDTRIICGGGNGFDVREKNTAATSPPCNTTEATIPPVNRGAAA